MTKDTEQISFEFEAKKTIKGYPELHWTGKRPFKGTVYYPAQLKESYGEAKDGWLNKIFWGDNLQVMSHLLKEFRGKVDLIYIDPPFDSKADYKKTIELRGQKVSNDRTVFEEKQYGDIWTNDEYLQFMFERLILLRELLSHKGSLYLHCDWHKSSHLRLLLDEVFGADNFRNEITWSYFGFKRATSRKFPQKHDLIYSYVKSQDSYTWNVQYRPHGDDYIKRFKKDANGRLYRDDVNPTGGGTRIIYLDEVEGDIIDSVWNDIPPVNPVAKERQDYPTQKPEALLERIIKSSTNQGDVVFDCFMGSGTTQAVAMKLGRKFIGADINLGAVQTTTKRLLNIVKGAKLGDEMYKGFEVYNVNNYEVFRNPLEARSILLQALEIEPFQSSSVYDGEKDGRMYKIMPADINRIATKADISGFIANLPYKTFERKKEENPNEPVLKLTVVCMGHEPGLKAAIVKELSNYKVDIEVVDILRDRSDLQFKRDAQGEVKIENGKLVIKSFYPLNLMQKLSMQRENVDEWRQLVESIMVDFNYDDAVLSPTVIDTPGKNELVKGVYDVPKDAGKIKIKVTDLLSESLEIEVEVK